MCGRSRVVLAPEAIMRAARTTHWIDQDRYKPSENVSPGRWTPVIRQRIGKFEGGEEKANTKDKHLSQEALGEPKSFPSVVKHEDQTQPTSEKHVAAVKEERDLLEMELVHEKEAEENMDEKQNIAIQSMVWGLIPSFTKKGSKPDPWRMFNARCETASQLASFRRLVPHRRCIVLMNGFYEWRKEGINGKVPYYVHFSGGEPMAMAGLYDCWEGPEGRIYSYTILTCPSSRKLEWLHDRMPVILGDRKSQDLWLNNDENYFSDTLIRKVSIPYNEDDLTWYPVTKAMSNPSFQGPESSQPVRKKTLKSFFKASNFDSTLQKQECVHSSMGRNLAMQEHGEDLKKDSQALNSPNETKIKKEERVISPQKFYDSVGIPMSEISKRKESHIKVESSFDPNAQYPEDLNPLLSTRKRQRQDLEASVSPEQKKTKTSIQKNIHSFFSP